MKVVVLSLPFLGAILALASPAAFDAQIVLNGITHRIEMSGNISTSGVTQMLHDVEGALGIAEDNVEQWNDEGRDFIKHNGMTSELVTHALFPEHRIRITQPKLCDPSVKQYSGYLDVSTGKHLFFWFFEARNSPESADFISWTNGGPGCSSMTGLLSELGPCTIADTGKKVTYNKHSWNEHANIVFLDQSVNVGYSYSDDGSRIDRSSAAGEDIYVFYQLFFERFPEYASAKFHLAAESYGGAYAPHVSSIIHRRNKALELVPIPDLVRINLASVILGNGIVDPLNQVPTMADFACSGPYAMYDDPEGPQCSELRSKASMCERFIKGCYNSGSGSSFSCVSAQVYCFGQVVGSLQQTGLNLYDVRKVCDRSKDGSLCYQELLWVETWLNDPSNQAALGANHSFAYQACNMDVNPAFTLQGDGRRSSAALLSELVDEGVRLLVYAGNTDAMTDFMGQERWVANFGSTFHDEFASSVATPWVTAETGRIAGEVRSAGGGSSTAGNLTLVTVYEAGHMVPYDQPEAASDLIRRWIANIPFTD